MLKGVSMKLLKSHDAEKKSHWKRQKQMLVKWKKIQKCHSSGKSQRGCFGLKTLFYQKPILKHQFKVSKKVEKRYIAENKPTYRLKSD